MAEKLAILIVDNDVQVALSTHDFLEEAGYEVMVACDGKAAVTLCNEQAFDLALIEIHLPDIPGLELVKDLTRLSPGMEYILITANASIDGAVQAARQKSVVSYESKPVDVEHLIHLFRQVTERRLAEKARRDSEKKYRLLVENANDAIFVLRNGFVKFHNNKLEELLGYTAQELVKTRFYNHIHSEDRDEVLGRYLRRRKGERFPGIMDSFRVINKSGEEIYVQINGVFITWEGRPATLCFLRDLTLQKELEYRFQQAQKMEAIGMLAGGIVHDLNNLLSCITLNVSLMYLDIDSGHPHYKRLKDIERYMKSSAELTGQLLTFAKGEENNFKLIDLNTLINAVSEMFGRGKKEITMNLRYQEDLWPVEVNPGQIEQVLLNLYVNAWQAMPGGGEIYVNTENIILDDHVVKPYGLEPGDYVKISVSDTGVGMDTEMQKRIFDPFFTTKEKGKGTGLGLASAYGVIKNHKGIIHVYSEKGRGTIFKIYLPASEEVALKNEELSGEFCRGTGTVLFVDDEEMIVDVGTEMLKAMGYKVLSAGSGNEALEVYKQNKHIVDIVVLDMVMLGTDGGQVYDRLKEINPDIKVLISSGYSTDGPVTEMLNRGCNGFIQKPFTANELSQKLMSVLNN